MPGLPAGGPWPPKPYDVALAQQALWSAWLVGDVARLTELYGGADGTRVARDFFSREGGLLPAIGRFFYGRPSVSGERRTKLHIPLAADIATASADLLFSEPPQFLISEEEEARKSTDYKPSEAQERVDACLNQGNFHAALLEAGEFASALGGAWLRLAWDEELFDQVIVEPLAADSALGEWRWGRLEAVTFFTDYVMDKNTDEVWRHLERHEKGRVLHGLYMGATKTLGTSQPLGAHPSTEKLAQQVDEESAILTGVDAITAAYVANMRPQRRWRTMETLSELGRSDYDGVEQLMDALDEVYTSWMRDIRLAKARLVVPETFLTDLGKGKGAAWDEDQEIYTALNMTPAVSDQGPKAITSQQFEIRFEAHRATADQLIDHILEAAGYSPATFGRGGEGDKTATEVVSRERQSARTRDKKTRYWTQALDTLLDTWCELEAAVFGSPTRGKHITVKWPDVSQPDQESLARTMGSLRTADAASTYTLVGMQHPDWAEDAINTEVERILSESGRSVPEPGLFESAGEGGA